MSRTRLCCWLCPLIGLALALLYLLSAAPAATAQTPAKPKPVSFINDIAPILKENCFACHDSKKRKGKMDMTTYASFRKGGINDDPVAPGSPVSSRILLLLRATGKERMPPREAGEALPKAKIDLIARWIQEGAKLDAGIGPKADLVRELRLRWQPPAPPAAYTRPALITALAFTPDGKKIVAGGHHELTVWDAATGRLEKRIATRAERAYGMVFLADGKLAMAGGRPGQEGDVRVYDLNAGMPKMAGGVALLDGVHDRAVFVTELAETDDSVLCIALSRDGKKLAAGGCDRMVRVWDVSGGAAKARLEQSIENHADWVLGVAFSPDGKHLATASRDKTAKVWDLAARESVLTFPDHQQPVYAVAVTADGKVGISAGEDNNVRYWHATDEGKQVGKQIRVGGGHGKAVMRLVYHGDPKNPLLATCSQDATVRLWNPTNGAALRVLSGLTDYIYAVDLSRDGSLVAGAGFSGEVRVWRTKDGALVKAFSASPGYGTAAPAAAAAGSKGVKVAAAGPKKGPAPTKGKAIETKGQPRPSAAAVDFARQLGLGFPSLLTLGARIEAARRQGDPCGLAAAARELAAAEKAAGKRAAVAADGLTAEAVRLAKFRFRTAEMKAVADLAGGAAGQQLLAASRQAEEWAARAKKDRAQGVKSRGIEGVAHIDSRVNVWLRVRVNGIDVGTLEPLGDLRAPVHDRPWDTTFLYAESDDGRVWQAEVTGKQAGYHWILHP
jgi:WD40 repeat protein